MAIARGYTRHPLAALAEGARCTWFLPAPEGRSARKRWIAGALAPLGTLTVDAGAARALSRGRSLLPAGVRGGRGQLPARRPGGDRRPGRRGAGARPVAPTPAPTRERIIGHRSDEIEAILGWRGRDEIVHRDDLVVL